MQELGAGRRTELGDSELEPESTVSAAAESGFHFKLLEVSTMPGTARPGPGSHSHDGSRLRDSETSEGVNSEYLAAPGPGVCLWHHWHFNKKNPE